MSTWQTIFGVEPPVKGLLSQFESARNTFDSMKSDAQTIVDTFFDDRSSITANVNDKPGAMIVQVIDEADGGLRELPRIAGEAFDIFDAHITRLRQLRGEADGALARARTAWNRKNQLTSQKSQLESQISGLEGQIDGAADDADTSDLDSDLSGAQSSLGSVDSELESLQNTLDAIYGNQDSDYNELVAAENERNRTTADDLDGISLGDLEDPNWLESAWEGISGFVQGLVESVANMLEALVTGDWATFFWELKGLLDVALLILGTIALFTGIGGPLGVLLITLAVASFALNTGLYITQTPNPQTGQTVGLLDVGISALGVVATGASLLRIVRTTTAINQAARGIPRLQTTFAAQFNIANAPGLRNGAIVSLFRNSGHHMANGATRLANASGRFGELAMPFPVGAAKVTQTVDDVSGLVTGLKGTTQQGLAATAWSSRGVIGGVQNFTPYSLPGDWSKTTGSKGLDTWTTTGDEFGGWNYSNGFGNFGEQGTPMFSGQPSRQQVMQVAQQVRQSPDVHIVPVP